MRDHILRDYILNTMSAAQRGLYLIESPTGYGKTYAVANAMKAYADHPVGNRKIIYLTTLNKNLPENELLKAYGGDKDLYRQNVLRIRSNFDEVTEKLEKLEIPLDFQTDAYQKLLSLIQRYSEIKAKRIADSEYLSDLKKRIDAAERIFRNEIARKLAKIYYKKSERLEAVRKDSQWRWVGELYPAVFTDDYRILLMSVHKFMKRNSCVVEPSYEFLKSRLIENAIIFIDEFDATKADIQNEIKEKALSFEGEYLSLFKQICRGLDPQYLSTDLTRAVKKAEEHAKAQYTLDSLRRDAATIIEKYHIYFSYKTVEEAVDKRQNFLLKDATYHTLFQENKEYIRAARNEKENRVDILMETREEFHSRRHDAESEISVYSLLREISRFLARFRVFLNLWADSYMNIINQRRGPDETADRMTKENALKAISRRLDLSDQQENLILGAAVPVEYDKKRALLPDISFYQRGLEIFELEDSDSHHESTDFRFISVRDTPEKILIHLARRAVIYGISATAEVPSVVGNYDLSYLREKLGDAYHPTPFEQKRNIQAELSKTWTAYREGKIRLHSEVMESDMRGQDLAELCEKIFFNPEYARICARYIEDETARAIANDGKNSGKSDFYQMRYFNIIAAMRRFCEESNIQSMLYLGRKLPRENDPELNFNILQYLFAQIIIPDVEKRQESSGVYMKDCAKKSLVVMSGENFDENKKELIERLENGEKIFIMSSYQTIGAGQNLQYRAPDRSKLVELIPDARNGDERHFYKDIDALYLADITYLTTNIYQAQNRKRKLTREELLDMLFQIEELKQSGELTFSEADQAIKLAFRAYTGKTGRKENNPLYKAESVQLQASRQVMQAIGRICRTYLKSPDIYIFIEKNLLAKLSPWELKKHILSPETRTILQLAENIGVKYPDEEEKRLKKAENISAFGMWKIREMLKRNWTEESMSLWARLREVTLKHPTADDGDRENDELIQELYITSGRPQKSYQYLPYYDYRGVVIDFSLDAVAFRNAARAKRETEGETGVHFMSENASRLPVILKYPGMRDYFKSHGFALKFETAQYMMSPPLFNNIYKGALGEVAGKFILKSELGIELSEIQDPKKFEFFDYEMSPDVYVDFKNWKFSYRQDREKTKREIRDKLEAIQGKRVYIVNIVGDEEYEPAEKADAKIVEIPGLIDESGNIIKKCIRMFREDDYL